MDVRRHSLKQHVNASIDRLMHDQVFYAYTYGTAAWLGIQAVPLIVLPKLITTLLAKELHETTGVCQTIEA
jgi:hypothetical protein